MHKHMLAPKCNEKYMLALLARKICINTKQQHGDEPTQGHFLGWSTNFAKKTDEAAISEGG
jgi:hypothetical protein